MSMATLGSGLSPRDGADPTDPSDRTCSVLDSESVLNRHSDEDMVGMGSLIWRQTKWKGQGRMDTFRRTFRIKKMLL